MTPQRIEELAEQAHEGTAWKRELIVKAIRAAVVEALAEEPSEAMLEELRAWTSAATPSYRKAYSMAMKAKIREMG